MCRNSIIVSVDIDDRRWKLPTLSVQLCTALLCLSSPQPSPQGAEEALIAHLAAPSGGVVGDTGSVQQS